MNLKHYLVKGIDYYIVETADEYSVGDKYDGGNDTIVQVGIYGKEQGILFKLTY
jgi:hypothetical protein